MCDPPDRSIKGPEVLLAELMRRELSLEVNPQALRMFIRHKWTAITALAHAIHERRPE